MMCRCLAPPLAALLVLGCGREPATDFGSPPDGRIALERVGRRSVRLVDAAARGSSCEADTTVVAVVLTGRVSAAVAARSRWPLQRARTFAVQGSLGPTGTAAVAIRPLGDSVGAAVVAMRGTLRLEPGDRINGVVDAIVLDTAGEEERITGSLRDIAVRRECGRRSP